MKHGLLIAAMTVALVGCSGNKLPEAHNADDAQTDLSLTSGKWRLADYAGDSAMVEMDSLENYYLTFADDNTFGMTTDCNSIGGQYMVVEDSLTFENIACTQMACPNEQVEVAMKRILPMISTYAILPDSSLQLRADMRTMARFTLDK